MWFQYIGSKRLDIKFFKDYLPTFNAKSVIVEPFCGSCMVSLYIKKNNPDVLYYHMNDNQENDKG